LRKQDDVSDAFLTEQSRPGGTQTVNADAAGGRHAVLQRHAQPFLKN
jgi:hypothetical protein